jgi:hypothetical protein
MEELISRQELYAGVCAALLIEGGGGDWDAVLVGGISWGRWWFAGDSGLQRQNLVSSGPGAGLVAAKAAGVGARQHGREHRRRRRDTICAQPRDIAVLVVEDDLIN